MTGSRADFKYPPLEPEVMNPGKLRSKGKGESWHHEELHKQLINRLYLANSVGMEGVN